MYRFPMAPETTPVAITYIRCHSLNALALLSQDCDSTMNPPSSDTVTTYSHHQDVAITCFDPNTDKRKLLKFQVLS